MSWEYGQLATEVYELDKPVGRPFPGLDYYTRQLAGITGRILEPACGTEPDAFRAIIIPAGSIMLLDGRDAAPRALGAFRASLVPGGRLILDIDVPSRSAGPAITSARSWERDPYLWTMQVMHTSYDPVANQGFTGVTVTADYRDGRPPGPRDQLWTFHAVRPAYAGSVRQ